MAEIIAEPTQRRLLHETQDMLVGTCAGADEPPMLPSGFSPPPPC